MGDVIQVEPRAWSKPREPRTGLLTDVPHRGSDDPDALECEWCSAWVAPLCKNATGTGCTYPRDEQGDVICAECVILPPWHVPTGNA